MFAIGIDVGGTFTDFLLSERGGAFSVYKVPTTPDDPSRGVMEGLEAMARGATLPLSGFLAQVEVIVHGTTVTTNAVLTGQGACTGLLTTRGFRDALEMRRGIREVIYDNTYQAPAPLVPRFLRLGIEERVDSAGREVTPLNERDVREACEVLRARGVEAVALCFMHSYANRSHEQRAAELVASLLPEAYISASVALLPQVRFYDRVSTTVLNAYVGPILRRYLTLLTEKLGAAGFRGPLLIMQSNGGVVAPGPAIEIAASTILSGPAGGPVAGVAYAAPQGYDQCLTIDMGGTSFDAALVRRGAADLKRDGQVNRLRLSLPMLDILTIGAGGGSTGWIDDSGLLRMGPQSAGALPGPACYGHGGERPTCTDADLVLGYLNKDFFLGGTIPLDERAAEQAIRRFVADPLGLDVARAAAGMYQVINVNMANGIKEVSVERGEDPREFPLIVAGGAGPVHAGMIALELRIPLLIVPRESSIFCAAGMLLSDFRHDYVRTAHRFLHAANPEDLLRLVGEMEDEGWRVLRQELIPPERQESRLMADLRYENQYHEITVPFARRTLEEGKLGELAQAFHQAHDRLYGYHLADEGTAIELLNLRLVALGRTEKPELPREARRQPPDARHLLKGERRIFLPRLGDFAPVPVYDGMRLGFGHCLDGPAIVEQVTTTIVVLPEFMLACDRLGSATLILKEERDRFLPRVWGES